MYIRYILYYILNIKIPYLSHLLALFYAYKRKRINYSFTFYAYNSIFTPIGVFLQLKCKK